MDELEKKDKKLKDKLKEHFRLVVLNDNTLEEVSTYKLSLLNIYLLISSALFLAGLLVVILLAVTPLKTFLPGYGDIQANKEFIELHEKTKELEREMTALTEYLDRSRNRLVGAESDEVDKQMAGTSTEFGSQFLLEFEEERELIMTPKPTISKAKLGQYYLLTPVSGPISAVFNPNEKHFGVDILGPKNTAVKAIMDGYVISSDWTLESGNTVAIQHANNIVSFYKHNSSILKKAGSFVQAGEAIAIIGNSGTLSDGPHLHFELWYNGHPVNPMEFINF